MSTVTAIPLGRITTTELRKMFNTRSGFWLLASAGLLALAATSMVILFAHPQELTYSSFTAAIGIPMSIVLPIIAILSVTSEWTQRSGLTTFTLVPHRGRILAGKALSCVGVALLTIPIAFGIGALGNLVGTTVAGVEPVWDLTPRDLGAIALAQVLSLLVGFMLGVVIRASSGAIVAYFLYAFVVPSLSMLLAASQHWYHDLQPWVDFEHNQKALLNGAVETQSWGHLAVTAALWLLLPLAIGLARITRAEVK
jgi:ABC-2 type transport system permease protein